MPKPSMFNPTRFSSRPSHQELIYHEMIRAAGNDENYTFEAGTLAEARLYANAMAYGRCKYTLERSGSQFHPRLAYELLPTLEREYGIVPVKGTPLADRRRELAAVMRIARGARRSNVETVLADLFGSDFVAYVTTDTADAVLSPADPEATGLYAKPGTPRSVFRLLAPIYVLGSPITVPVAVVVNGSGTTTPLSAGDRFVIDPGSPSRREATTPTAVTTVGTAINITATFLHPHNAGVLLTTGRHPNQATSKRHNLFILSDTAAINGEKRKRFHRAIRRLLRAVSTWSLADMSGPFKVGVGRIGVTTIGEVTL